MPGHRSHGPRGPDNPSVMPFALEVNRIRKSKAAEDHRFAVRLHEAVALNADQGQRARLLGRLRTFAEADFRKQGRREEQGKQETAQELHLARQRLAAPVSQEATAL